MYKLKQLYQDTGSSADYVSQVSDLMVTLMQNLDSASVASAIEAVDTAAKNGKAIYVIGNGGSAAVASHFVNDMGVNSFVEGERSYRVYCLADNFASVTAVANDVSFEDIFKRQLQCDLLPGDVVIAMSVSGNSENITRAVEFANANGGVTIGMCGFEGGRLRELANHVIHFPASLDEYGPVEDGFSIVCHMISSYLSMARGRFLHH